MRIFVAGATGVLGRHVIPRLLERRHQGRAVVRREKQATILQRVGAEAVIGDILDAARLISVTTGCDAALHLATAIPKDGTQDWSMNDRIRREGTENLIRAAEANGVRRYVQQSITLLYGEHGAETVDETTAIAPIPFIQSAADMEARVRASSLDWCILRAAFFYGAGSGAHTDEAWRQAAQSGDLRLPGDGGGMISLIHPVDMARAVVAATESAPARSIFNVTDDEPVTHREVLNYIAARVGSAEPAAGGDVLLPSVACSNKRIKESLGWTPVYPTYRSGLA